MPLIRGVSYREVNCKKPRSEIRIPRIKFTVRRNFVINYIPEEPRKNARDIHTGYGLFPLPLVASHRITKSKQKKLKLIKNDDIAALQLPSLILQVRDAILNGLLAFRSNISVLEAHRQLLRLARCLRMVHRRPAERLARLVHRLELKVGRDAVVQHQLEDLLATHHKPVRAFAGMVQQLKLANT